MMEFLVVANILVGTDQKVDEANQNKMCIRDRLQRGPPVARTAA